MHVSPDLTLLACLPAPFDWLATRPTGALLLALLAFVGGVLATEVVNELLVRPAVAYVRSRWQRRRPPTAPPTRKLKRRDDDDQRRLF